MSESHYVITLSYMSESLCLGHPKIAIVRFYTPEFDLDLVTAAFTADSGIVFCRFYGDLISAFEAFYEFFE
jgi:hypothetical protein